jgi:hypothetical protein
MSTAEKAENRPAQPAPEGASKERMDVVLAYAEGKVYEIPTDVAKKYESSDDHGKDADEDEVGGRHLTWLPGLQQYGYGSNWLVGSYIWITDGRSYRGPHWHPNVNSPFAYDMDNY